MAKRIDKERYPLYLPVELMKKVEDKADKEVTNRSIVVAQILQEYFNGNNSRSKA